jgi:hypothetical protein
MPEPKIVVVLTADEGLISAVRAVLEVREHVEIRSVNPLGFNVEHGLNEADLVLGDLQALPVQSLARPRLYELLRLIPCVFFYRSDEVLTYERTREAYRSGARNLLPMAPHPEQFARCLQSFWPSIERDIFVQE